MTRDEAYQTVRRKALANLAFAGKVAEKTGECMADWSRIAGLVGCEAEMCKHIHIYEGALSCVCLLLNVMLERLEDDGEQEPVDELCRTVSIGG